VVWRECQQELLAVQTHHVIPLEPFFSTVKRINAILRRRMASKSPFCKASSIMISHHSLERSPQLWSPSSGRPMCEVFTWVKTAYAWGRQF
jgi:hypothetical protein